MMTGDKIVISSNHHRPLEDEQDDSLNKLLDFTVQLSGEDEEEVDGNKMVESEVWVILIMRLEMSFSIIPEESAYEMKGSQVLRQSRTSVNDQSYILLKISVVFGNRVSFMAKKTAQQ